LRRPSLARGDGGVPSAQRLPAAAARSKAQRGLALGYAEASGVRPFNIWLFFVHCCLIENKTQLAGGDKDVVGPRLCPFRPGAARHWGGRRPGPRRGTARHTGGTRGAREPSAVGPWLYEPSPHRAACGLDRTSPPGLAWHLGGSPPRPRPRARGSATPREHRG